MCLRLKYAEAQIWKRKARETIDAAKTAAASNPCDPLLMPNPRLSALVSEIDSIKKRHGLLIEEALIFAINKVPGWVASKEKIAVAGGRAHLDCLAFNASHGLLYVFECKRGHGNFDADKTRAIDDRLDRIKLAIASHAARKGWSPSKQEVFILSFYGTKWKSRYPIHDRSDVSKLFSPCLGSFVQDYMRHVENATNATYADELRGTPSLAGRQDSIFDSIDDQVNRPELEIEFDHTAGRLVPARI
jgi:hypothetical protein